MLSHIEKIHVTVTANLAKTDFPFEDLMNLQAGDVLMLDKKIDQPIELLVKNKPVFRGTPASRDGKFAAVITEIVN
jgi:flagellar motor switch protein FliM